MGSSVSYSSSKGDTVRRSRTRNKKSESPTPLRQIISLLQKYEQALGKVAEKEGELKVAQQELAKVAAEVREKFAALDPATKQLVEETFGFSAPENGKKL